MKGMTVLAGCLWLGLACSAAPAADDAPPRLGFRAKTLEEAKAWRQTARSALRTLLLGEKTPDKLPLDPEVLCRREDLGAYVYELVEITSRRGRRILVHVGIPRDVPGKRPVLVALHGHGTGQWGGAGVFGRGGMYSFGREMVEHGYLVVAPDLTPTGGKPVLYHGQKEDWPPTHDDHALDEVGWKGWTLAGQRTWDAMRALDYVLTRADADGGRVACMGHSMGGETATVFSALDDRVKVAVISGSLCRFEQLEKSPGCRRNNCNLGYLPGMRETFEPSDVAGLIAPRPVMIQSGSKDPCTVDTASAAYAELAVVYNALAVADRLTHHTFDGGHTSVPAPAREWIERFLKP